MSSRLDYSKAKRRRPRPGSANLPPWPKALRGWRTEWPEEFPVQVSRVKPELGPPFGEPSATDSGESHETLRRAS